MTTEHPITPPPELVRQWIDSTLSNDCSNDCIGAYPASYEQLICTAAARWGADQELEACIDVIFSHPGLEHPELLVEVLRAARRPKPPSLKEQSLALIDKIQSSKEAWQTDELDVVRRALEGLDD